MVIVLYFHDTTASRFPKRGINCESFCSSGFQGSIGSCNCGYIMFSKRCVNVEIIKKLSVFKKTIELKSRSDSYHHYLDDYDDVDDEIITKSHHLGDPILAELTDEEIVNALYVLDKIKENQHHAKELSDREVNY